MNLFSFIVTTDAGIHIDATWGLILLLLVALVAIIFIRHRQFFSDQSYLEVNEAEIGIGTGKIKLKANIGDLQIGLQFWTELSTRKIGLAFDDEHDVIVEIYNSWYEFFKIARELIKAIPVTKIRNNATTKELVIISIHILNKELRPHLTRWQARYRRWWETALADPANNDKTPQELQRSYPHYKELVEEIKAVNGKLVIYTDYLRKMVGI
jgi:hypothetical protein